MYLPECIYLKHFMKQPLLFTAFSLSLTYCSTSPPSSESSVTFNTTHKQMPVSKASIKISCLVVSSLPAYYCNLTRSWRKLPRVKNKSFGCKRSALKYIKHVHKFLNKHTRGRAMEMMDAKGQKSRTQTHSPAKRQTFSYNGSFFSCSKVMKNWNSSQGQYRLLCYI